MTPEQFWIGAAQWGRYIRAGDPGSCMYSFDERGLVQSEAHRAECIAWLDGYCRQAALLNDDPTADARQIDALIEYLRAAPITHWSPMPRRLETA